MSHISGPAPSAPDPATSMQVLHAVNMTVDLIEPSFDESLPIHVQRACRESFAMNVRLLAQFLKDKDDGTRLTASAYLGRPLDLAEDAPAVGCVISWTSKHVAHFDRAARADLPLVPLTREDLTERAVLLVRAMSRFSDALNESDSLDAATFQTHIAGATERLSAAPESGPSEGVR